VLFSLGAFWLVQDENDNAQVQHHGEAIRDAARRSGVPWLLDIHARKAEGADGSEIRGAAALAGVLDCWISQRRGARKKGEADSVRYFEVRGRLPHGAVDIAANFDADHGAYHLVEPEKSLGPDIAERCRLVASRHDGRLTFAALLRGLGMTDIASLPERIRGNRDAVAEVITNNVRSRIVREHLHDPAFYDRMSTLLAEVLADLKARRIDYEEFLKRMAEIAAQVRAGQADDTPEPLTQNAGLRALYNTLAAAPASSSRVAETKLPDGTAEVDPVLERAQQIDARLRANAPDGWRGVLPKEQEVKRLIYEAVQDTALVELLFPVIKARSEY
jgi:hypothetical protein